MTTSKPIPAVSFQTARTGVSSTANALGMRVISYATRGNHHYPRPPVWAVSLLEKYKI